MIKALIEIFRKTDLLHQAYEASVVMLREDQKMFEAAYKSLRRSDSGEIEIDIYQEDIKINKFERDIRRKVLTHLVTTPSKDLVFGLILVSIVIDIERIGDYTKNIVELAANHPKKLHGGPFETDLSDIENKVSERFRMLIEAFQEIDSGKARSLMLEHRSYTQRCDGILKSLLSREYPELTIKQAVSISLYGRYLKRISSHITNIASGIVNPFDRIGFAEKQESSAGVLPVMPDD